jgi:hypothetical protein
MSTRSAFKGTPERIYVDYAQHRNVREVVERSRRTESFNENQIWGDYGSDILN